MGDPEPSPAPSRQSVDEPQDDDARRCQETQLKKGGFKPSRGGFPRSQGTDVGEHRESPREALGDEAFEAYKKIQRLASASERSTKGIRERLAKDGYASEAIEEALARAVSYRIIDDRRYAEAYVRAKMAAGKGRRSIEAEIRDLGFDPDELDEWSESSEDDEVARAIEILKKRPPTAKNKRDAAYRRLVSKGYSASAAQSAARIWSESS